MHVVAVLAMDAAVGFELMTPCVVFATSSRIAGDHRYEVRVCTAEPGPLAVEDEHVAITSTWGLDAVAALRAAAERGARVASVCTGAFDLASAGLLDGLRATTHWHYAAELARRYPRVAVDPSVLYIEQGRILTSAGVTAGVDLCLHLIRRDHGARFASAVARAIVAPPQRPGGQAQFLRHSTPADPDASLRPTLAWLTDRITEPVTLAEIARHAGTSVRTLSRRFRDELGCTPVQWLTQTRVHRAQQLLESTTLPIETIAARTGFGAANTLRHHFTRLVGTSPLAYRRTFRA